MIDLTSFHPAMFARIAIATALGAFVGFARERVGKPAGVRTHGIVALGSALFTVVSIYGFEGKSDPARIAAQVVTGVGFLGAGTILRVRGSVHGLTTAATLWVTAAIGVAVGAGMTLMSIETAALAWILLRFGPRLESPTCKAGANDDSVR